MSANLNIGDKVNQLTVIGKSFPKNGRKYVPCRCDCGTVKDVRDDSLKGGVIKSCGCLRLDRLRETLVTHGKSKTGAYSSWEGMMQRCKNPKASNYYNYGGRGIRICDRWLDFENFYSDMGDRPNGLSLERVDVNGNYCKENCRWDNPSNQSFNQRKSSNNTSGKTGVSWSKSRCKWEAYIMKDRKKINLGRYETLEEAVSAREQGEIKYYGFVKGS